MSEWKKISKSEAETHSLYGVKGWLLVYALGVVLGPLSDLGQVGILASKVGITVTELLSEEAPASKFLRYVLTLEFFMSGVILVIIARKDGVFRGVASSWMICSFPIVCVIGYLNSFDGLGEILGQTFLSWVISSGIWVSYLNISKRVRVTFEHRTSVSTKADRSNLRKAEQSSTLAPRKFESLETLVEESNNRKGSGSDYRAEDEPFFAIVAGEIGTNLLDVGLWNRLLVENGGDEIRTKVKYIETRVARLRCAPRPDVPSVARADEAEAVTAVAAPLGAKSSDAVKLPTATRKASDSLKSETELMVYFGIARDSNGYTFENFRFANVRDAIEYARLTERPLGESVEDENDRLLIRALGKPIRVEHYMAKHGCSKSEVNHAISLKKMEAYVIGDQLWVQDKPL